MLLGREQKLSVKIQYKSTAFAVEIPASATFGELRFEAASRIGIPADAFVLKFRGREKSNSERLLTAGLKNGACVLAQETAVHEAIRGASFAGLQQQTPAAPSPARYQQSLHQQQATAGAHSSTTGNSYASTDSSSHLNPHAPAFLQPAAQSGHPRVYVSANGQGNGRGDEQSLQQNEVHGARYPQARVTAGGQAASLAQHQRSPVGGVPANWEGQFTSSDGGSKVAPCMSQQRQHHAEYYADNIKADRRQKRQMFAQHQEVQRQQAEAHGQRQQQQQQQQQPPLPLQDSRKQSRFVGPRPQLSPEEQMLAMVAVQEREMDAFAQQVDDYTGSIGGCADVEEAKKQKVVLTEMLTRVMLALDGVRPSDGGETPVIVRTARRAAIVRAEALINRVEATSAANARAAR